MMVLKIWDLYGMFLTDKGIFMIMIFDMVYDISRLIIYLLMLGWYFIHVDKIRLRGLESLRNDHVKICVSNSLWPKNAMWHNLVNIDWY